MVRGVVRHAVWAVAGVGWLVQMALPFTQRGPLAASTPWQAARFAASDTMPASVPWWVAPGLLVLPALAVVLLVCRAVPGATAAVAGCALVGVAGSLGLVHALGGVGNLAAGGWWVLVGAGAATVGVGGLAVGEILRRRSQP